MSEEKGKFVGITMDALEAAIAELENPSGSEELSESDLDSVAGGRSYQSSDGTVKFRSGALGGLELRGSVAEAANTLRSFKAAASTWRVVL